jgi:hypothetical protein
VQAYYKCPYSFCLATYDVESKPTEKMKYGSQEHDKIWKSLEQGVIPDKVTPYFKALNVTIDDIEAEVDNEREYEGITWTGRCDIVADDFVLDWKFIADEGAVVNYYERDEMLIQQKLYCWLTGKNIIYYAFPDYPEAGLKKWTYGDELQDGIDKLLNPIVNAIHDQEYPPNFDSCGSCLYSHACAYMNPKVIDTAVQKYHSKQLITRDNCIEIFAKLKQAEAVIKEARKRIEDIVNREGDIKSDGMTLYMAERKGRKRLKKGITYEKIIKNLGGNSDDYYEVGEPTYSLKLKEVKDNA